jgi:chromosome segregation ATPase
MREVFDASIDAVLKGTELQKTVTELSASVLALKGEIGSLQRDLEYIRNRNRELDEQVSQVRVARDEAIRDASEQRTRADAAERLLDDKEQANGALRMQLSGMYDRIDALKKERDDAQMAQMEMEDKLKAAEATLAKVQACMAEAFGASVRVMEDKAFTVPRPHYETQPRDEVGKFQPLDAGSQGTY